MNCHYCRFLACCDRPGAAYHRCPVHLKSGTLWVLTESLSERDFAAWKKVRQELRGGALQLGLGLGFFFNPWCARSKAPFRDHTTDAACGASSEQESRCRSAVSILAYRTISFPGHFWFSFSLKESCFGSVFRVLSRFLCTFWDY
jgi:hypothetical protein